MRDYDVRNLSPVKLEGKLALVDGNLKFVVAGTGQKWKVSDNVTVREIVSSRNGELNSHIEALSSPRYIFGGSYLEVQRVEPLANEAKTIHVCSL